MLTIKLLTTKRVADHGGTQTICRPNVNQKWSKRLTGYCKIQKKEWWNYNLNRVFSLVNWYFRFSQWNRKIIKFRKHVFTITVFVKSTDLSLELKVWKPVGTKKVVLFKYSEETKTRVKKKILTRGGPSLWQARWPKKEKQNAKFNVIIMHF